jgi:hypothetical protein
VYHNVCGTALDMFHDMFVYGRIPDLDTICFTICLCMFHDMYKSDMFHDMFVY